jgi:hypothetical protein
LSSADLDAQAEQGAWTLILRVRNYNGTANDGQVRAAIYLSPGTSSPPAWNGADTWSIADTSLTDMTTVDSPVTEDTVAYVSGQILVAHFASVPLVFDSPSVHLAVDLRGVTLMATLEPPDAGGWRLTQGTIAGKWTIADLFTDLSALRVGGAAVCTDAKDYTQIKHAFCGAADIALQTGAQSACDSLSFGMAFEAWPAKLGAPVTVPPPAGGCPAATDPKTDTCN